MRSLIAALLIAAAVPAAAAAQTIDERQNAIFRRIDEGVRNNALTREDANRLRREFFDIAELERRYRYDGLTQYERQDLNRRFDDLSRRINRERADTERVPQALYERRAQVERSIQEGIRGGGLSRREADQAYYQLSMIDRQLNNLRRSGDGISRREREEISRRLEQVAREVLAMRRNGEQGGGYGRRY
jgi:hypothetical protein